jgi:cytochrome c-type biogenesis protein CcmH
MTVWFIFGAMTAVVLLLLIRPLMRRPQGEQPRFAYDQAVYRDQLAEVARDVQRGVVSEQEARAIRLEVERRLLAAAPKSIGATAASAAPAKDLLRPAPGLATALILVVPAAAILLYVALGAPGAPDRPFASRGVERSIESDDGSLDIAKVRTALMARLAKDPNSLEGWVLLARTDANAQDWQGARDAWQKALAISHGDYQVLENYGELLVMQAQGQVTAEAQQVLHQAVAKDSRAYRARFYLAMARLQAGDRAGAIADWRNLQKDAPANSPWRQEIDQTIKSLDQPAEPASSPVATAPGGDGGMAGAMMALPPAQRSQAIEGMVAGLAARLQQNPNDLAGWKRLARSYAVLGQPMKAADAYAQAARLDPKDATLLVGQADALGTALPQGSGPSEAMIKLYQQALVLDPRQADSLWMLGYVAHNNHQDSVAGDYWRRLLAILDPASQDYADVKKAIEGLSKS